VALLRVRSRAALWLTGVGRLLLARVRLRAMLTVVALVLLAVAPWALLSKRIHLDIKTRG